MVSSSRMLQYNIMRSLSYGSKFETRLLSVCTTGTHREHGDLLEEKGMWKENLKYICDIQHLPLFRGERQIVGPSLVQVLVLNNWNIFSVNCRLS
jgi:hypothetical protein